MWVNTSDINEKQSLIIQRDSSDYIWDGQYKITLNEEDYDITAWNHVWPVSGRIDKYISVADQAIQESKWYHIAYTIEDIDTQPIQKLYINGEKVNSKSLAPNQISLTNQIKVYLGGEGRHIAPGWIEYGYDYFNGQWSWQYKEY